MLREGRLAAVEEIGTLKARRSRTYSVTLSTPAAAAAFAAAPGLRVQAAQGCTVTVRVRDGMAALTTAMARFPVTLSLIHIFFLSAVRRHPRWPTATTKKRSGSAFTGTAICSCCSCPA